MLDFERSSYEPTPKRPMPRKHYSPLATLGAVLLLAFGVVFGRIGAFCTGAAYRWTDTATVRTWTRAITYFRGISPGTPQPQARWERLIMRFGSSVLLGIGGTLMVMWLLLLLGGALVWLASHGFGFYMLLGAVCIGTVIGLRLALLGRFGANDEQLN